MALIILYPIKCIRSAAKLYIITHNIVWIVVCTVYITLCKVDILSFALNRQDSTQQLNKQNP